MSNPTSAGDRSNGPRNAILVVDDDEAVRTGLRCVLASEGYDVVTANNGLQAIASFDARPCDLALIDMNMPLRNGWGAIASLRSLAPVLPMIIITARPDQRTVAREAGVELMEKPLDLPLLLNRIKALLDESHCGAPLLNSASLPP
jgi:DNA-binding response OmpR family regulator